MSENNLVGDIDRVVTTHTTATSEPLTYMQLAKTIGELGDAPRIPVKAFTVDIDKQYIDEQPFTITEDIMRRWRRTYSNARIVFDPPLYFSGENSWGYRGIARIVPFTRKELRHMRKQMRTSDAKRLFKQLKNNYMLCEPDPRLAKKWARKYPLVGHKYSEIWADEQR